MKCCCSVGVGCEGRPGAEGVRGEWRRGRRRQV